MAGKALMEISPRLLRINHFLFATEVMTWVPPLPCCVWFIVCAIRSWRLTHCSSWKIPACTASTLAYQWVSESRLEYLFIPGKQSLRGTPKHCLQISEGLSQGRMRFVLWLPTGKTDTRIVVIKEMKTMIMFIDTAGSVVGTWHAWLSS